MTYEELDAALKRGMSFSQIADELMILTLNSDGTAAVNGFMGQLTNAEWRREGNEIIFESEGSPSGYGTAFSCDGTHLTGGKRQYTFTRK